MYAAVTVGDDYFGLVKRCGSTYIVTQFGHVSFVPLFPKQSFLVLDDGSPAKPARWIPIGYHGLSILMAYSRVAGPVLAFSGACLCLFALMPAITDGGRVLLVSVGGFALLLGLLLLLPMLMHLGEIDSEEMARRRIHAVHLEYPIDPADLGSERTRWRATLLDRMRRARGAPDIATSWEAIAADPAMSDVAFLTAAYSLARIEASLSSGAHRRRLVRLAQQLFERVGALT